MAWIELHQSLPGHRKIMRLRRTLKIGQAQAVGHLCMLWLWCLDNCPDGDLSDLMECEIAEAAGYDGKKPEAFAAALQDAGFLDQDMRIHDWNEYAGRLIDKREANAKRMRDKRARAEHVQRTCNARASNVHEQDKESETHVQGLPYTTVPYTTVPKKEEEDEEERARDWNPFGAAPEVPPTETVEAYIATNISSRVSSGMIDKLDALEADGATPELIRYAVDAACETAQGPPRWNLFETILRNWLAEGVRTVGEAKAAQAAHKARKEQTNAADRRHGKTVDPRGRESPPGSAGDRYKPDPAEIERIARARGVL